MALVKHGVPYDLAFLMTEEESLAHFIGFGMQEGGKWDWGAMEWEKEE